MASPARHATETAPQYSCRHRRGFAREGFPTSRPRSCTTESWKLAADVPDAVARAGRAARRSATRGREHGFCDLGWREERVDHRPGGRFVDRDRLELLLLEVER